MFVADYHYKAYFQNLINFGKGAQSSWLQCAGWYMDEKGKFDDLGNNTTGASDNSGCTNRAHLFMDQTESKDGYVYHGEEREFCGKLMTDIATSNICLVPGVSLKIVLKFASQDFVMMDYAEDAE